MSDQPPASSSEPGPATGGGGEDRAADATPNGKPWHRRHLWQVQAVRDLLLIVLAWLLLRLGYELSLVTVPMLVGLGLAYLVEPLVAALARRWRVATRPRVVIGLLAGLITGGLLVIAIAVPLVVSQVGQLARNTPGYLRTALELADHDRVPDDIREELRHLESLVGGRKPGADRSAPVPADDVAPSDAPDGPESAGAQPAEPDDAEPAAEAGTAREELAGGDGEAVVTAGLSEEAVRRIVREELGGRQAPQPSQPSGLAGTLGAALGTAWSVLSSIVSGTIALAIGAFLVAFFYVVFALHYPRVLAFGRSLIPGDRRERWCELAAQMDRAVSGFVRGRLLIAAILALVFVVGWSAVGVPYAIVLGLVVGALTLVPYLAGVGLLLAYLLLIIDLLGGGDGGWYRSDGAIVWWAVTVLPAIPFVVAQLLDDYLLSPLIQGKATNLSPAAIVVAVLAGGALAGVYGMLLAIPAAACIKILVVAEVWPRVESWLRGERQDPLPFEGDESAER